jgi:hypothetical protein
MQIKTTMRYHFIRKAVIKKTKKQKINIGEDAEKMEPPCNVGGMRNGIATEKKVGGTLKEKKEWPSISIVSYTPNRNKSRNSDTCTPMCIAELFT